MAQMNFVPAPAQSSMTCCTFTRCHSYAFCQAGSVHILHRSLGHCLIQCTTIPLLDCWVVSIRFSIQSQESIVDTVELVVASVVFPIFQVPAHLEASRCVLGNS